MTDDGPRWAGRIMIAVYIVGFLSAVVIIVKLLAGKVVSWVREKGGW